MKALIIVDIQHDFLPGGALAVKDGDLIIEPVNKLMEHFPLIVATQDWHPADHLSFASNHPSASPGDVIDLEGLPQVLWPDHCVQGSVGAAFAETLDTSKIDKIFRKGENRHIDSYSGFFDNGKKQDTGMYAYLKKQQIDEVFVVGLATDYCVKFTAIDAAALGLKTSVIANATKAVNLKPGDGDMALKQMSSLGIGVVDSTTYLI
ncbi:MAG: bifunctional nicotinamidase/pyrazinamidase [Cyclobacteriaceae bacterium]|nr:bifunctional nicotinamidase/pyrazinamidase [Cyclobacteriaceae bacterium]